MTVKIILDDDDEKIIEYSTREEMKLGKKEKTPQGFRPLHTDFKNNKESDGYLVNFVKGTKDPHNAPELVEERRLQKIDRDRIKVLKEKKRNNTLSQQDKDEIIKRMVDML